MNHCRDCKHWGDEDDKQLAPKDDVRDCMRIVHRDRTEEVLAYTMDASGYHSALITYPDFGCVLWEPEP